MRTKFLLVAALMAGAACAVPAAPVTIEFTGTVAQSPLLDPANPFGGAIDTGTRFHGSYTFDSAAVDQVADPRTGFYAAAGGPFGVTVTFGDPGVLSIHHADLGLGVGNGFAGGADFYTLAAPGVATPDTLALSLILVDTDGTAWDSDALPGVAPALDAFETRSLSVAGLWFDGNGQATQVEILGSIDSLRCTAGCSVPEPSGSWFVAAAAAAWAARRRRPAAGPFQAMKE